MSLSTTAPSYTAGQVLTASQLNNLQDGIQAPWATYVPSWTATGTNPTLGNGSLTGQFLQIGKLIFVRVALTTGSTTALGTGQYSISLPIPPNQAGAGLHPLAIRIVMSGQNAYHGMTYGVNGGSVSLAVDSGVAGGGLALVGPTVPGSWPAGSSMSLGGAYEAA